MCLDEGVFFEETWNVLGWRPTGYRVRWYCDNICWSPGNKNLVLLSWSRVLEFSRILQSSWKTCVHGAVMVVVSNDVPALQFWENRRCGEGTSWPPSDCGCIFHGGCAQGAIFVVVLKRMSETESGHLWVCESWRSVSSFPVCGWIWHSGDITTKRFHKISTSDGIKHCFQQMKHLRIRSWKDNTSQNYRIRFNCCAGYVWSRNGTKQWRDLLS